MIPLDEKEGVALASGHHLKCEALSGDVIGIRHGNPGHGVTWIYCSVAEAQAIQAQLAEAITAAARPAQAMSDEDLLRHQDTHTKENSWWTDDAKGIPLCRICDECEEAALAKYKPEVLGLGRRSYEDVVEEPIDEPT